MSKQVYAILIFCFSVVITHAQIVFKATVDKNPVALGDDFQITFEVDNAQVNKFHPPGFDNFTILSGPNQGSSFVMNGNNTSQSETFMYELQPKAIGKFTIGPASVTAGNNTYQSNPINIEVVKGSSSSANNNGQNKSSGVTDLSKDIFMIASVDKPTAYEGEQVTLTYKVYLSSNIVGIQSGIDETPSFNGFWAEDFDIGKSKTQVEVYNGKKYQTFIVRKTALFASQLGKLTIDPLKLKTAVQVAVKNKSYDPFQGMFNFDPFGAQVQELKYTVSSNAITIDIKPLPDAGKPADFTGAVGKFSIESRMDTGSLKTDDPIPMSVMLKGQGNLKLIDAPKPQLPVDFDIYPPKTNEDISNKSSIINGTKVFDFLFTPHTPGHYIIPPINFSYFDPDSRQYVVLHTSSYNLNIEKGKGVQTIISNGLSKQDIKLLNKDIRYIHENTTLVIQGKPFAGSGLFYSLLILPILVFGAIFFWLDRERKLRGDIIGMKTRQARKLAIKKLITAKQLLQNKDSKGFYNEVSRALWGYIGDKLNIPASVLSRDNVVGYLHEKQVQETTTKELFGLFDHCELALYAPSTAGSDMDLDYEKAADMISKLEQEIK